MTDKLYSVAGVSKLNGAYKVRFANDLVGRIKALAKSHEDVQLHELPREMSKAEVVSFLKTHELYTNPAYREAIDNADEKYNGTASVKVKATKAKKAEPSMDALKARAEAKAEAAE
jgi:ribosomal protein S21